MFIPSKLTWKEKGLTMTQLTSFPESDKININIEEAPASKVRLKLRYPSWSGEPEVKVNGRRVAVRQSPGSYISIDRKWNKGDKVEVRYPMELRIETTVDNPKCGALLYGPVVLAGDMGNKDVRPFSDPTVRNDYYTYDYKIPADIDSSLSIDPSNPGKGIFRDGEKLCFHTSDGKILKPLYDTHRVRYTVYWDFK